MRPLWLISTWSSWIGSRLDGDRPHHQVRVAAGADQRIGAEVVIARELLERGLELALVLGALVRGAPPPFRAHLEERELDEVPLSHRHRVWRMRIALLPALAAAALAAAPALGGRPGGPGVPPGRDGRGPARAVADADLAVGVVSPTAGGTAATQTYLDMSQGTRVSSRVYEEELPSLRLRPDGRIEGWDAVVRRADDAPGDVIPGLLGENVPRTAYVGVEGLSHDEAAVAADRSGRVDTVSLGPRGGFGARLAKAARSHDLVVSRPARRYGARARSTRCRRTWASSSFARPPGSRRAAARGWPSAAPGSCTSRTTRRDGMVAVTDFAPTILRRLGRGVPDEMQGRPMTAADGSWEDAQSLADRLANIKGRRSFALLAGFGAWLALTGALARGRARLGLRLGLLRRDVAAGRRAAHRRARPGARRRGGDPRRWLAAAGRGHRPADRLAARARAARRGRARGPRGRPDRRLAADHPLARGPQPGLRRALLRHRKRARGDPDRDAPDRRGSVLRRPPGPQPAARVRGRVRGRRGVRRRRPARGGRGRGDHPRRRVPPPRCSRRFPAGSRWRPWPSRSPRPCSRVGCLAAVDIATGGDSHFTRSVLGADSAGELVEVAERRFDIAWNALKKDTTPISVAVFAAVLVWGVVGAGASCSRRSTATARSRPGCGESCPRRSSAPSRTTPLPRFSWSARPHWSLHLAI